MKPTSLGQNVAALRLALLASLLVLAAGPAARLACATGADWSKGQRDPQDPSFLAVPAQMLQPAMVASSSSASPSTPATTIAQAPAAPAAPERSGGGPAPSQQDASIDAHAKGKTL